MIEVKKKKPKLKIKYEFDKSLTKEEVEARLSRVYGMIFDEIEKDISNENS